MQFGPEHREQYSELGAARAYCMECVFDRQSRPSRMIVMLEVPDDILVGLRSMSAEASEISALFISCLRDGVARRVLHSSGL